MFFDMNYWTRVLKNVIYFLSLLIGLYLALKLSIFYMPFLIAFIISLIIEPLIKYIMKKTNLTRRTSSIIIFIIVSSLIIGLFIWLLITLFSESSKLLGDLNFYIDKTYTLIKNIITSIKIDKIKISNELLKVIESSTGSILNNLSNWIKNILSSLISFISSIPSIAICIGITVVALYFICVDKIYILDQIEHHVPKIWLIRIKRHLKDLIETLGGYLKAQAILIIISFFISLIGLYLLKILGFKIAYPLLMAIFIGFVDALPILGSRNSNDSMGYIFRFKWRYKFRNINNCITSNNVNYKTIVRT